MNENRSPRVSIGLPVFNGEAQLAGALDALLGQSYSDFELLLSDNHSTDGTEAICRDYAARDPRIRYERSPVNQGAAWNFNRVLERASGHYFKWASSNDVHAPDFLARCVDVLDRRPEVVLCYSKTRLIDETGQVLRDAEDNLDLPWPEASRRFREFIARVRLSNPIFGVLRPEPLRRAGGLKNYPGSDVVLLGELSLHGVFFEVPEYLFQRRWERQNEVRNESVDNWQEFFDPATRGKMFLRTWRHQYEYLRAALRSPLSLAEKVRVAAFIGRDTVAQRGDLARELALVARRITTRRAATKS